MVGDIIADSRATSPGIRIIRQKIVERYPGAIAFGAPMFMVDGEPEASNSISVSGQSSVI